MNENIGSKWTFFGHEVHFLSRVCTFFGRRLCFLCGEVYFYCKKEIAFTGAKSGETGFAHGGVCIAN
jgi:hypothetical protein